MMPFAEGDELELEVLKVEEDALILSKRKVDAVKAWEHLREKFQNSEIFEAEVKDVVKGGLVVDLRRTWICSSFFSRISFCRGFF